MYVDISKVDTNFQKGTQISKEDLVWINILDAPISIRGLAKAKEGRFLRLPEELLPKLNDALNYLAQNTAGGRIRFRTDSPYIAYRAKPLHSGYMPHMPLTGSIGTDIFVNGISCYTFRPNHDSNEWFEGILEIGQDVENMQGMKDVELNMGLYNGITEAYIGLKAGCILEAPTPYTIDKPIVFYGNSVTQGGCASKPGNSFPAFLCRWLDADHINLGFSGAGRAEEIMAHHIAGLDMSLFFMDYDHNADIPEYLAKTHYPFYKIIRDANPDLPIIMASMPNLDLQPTQRKVRRDIIYANYERALSEGDRKVWFVDGVTLFGDKDRDACTMDGAHPNDLGFYRMATNLLPYLQKALGIE